jgi:acyl transferase domain-containing protein
MAQFNLNCQWEDEVLIIQGASRSKLIEAVMQIQRLLTDNPKIDLKDLAYTLNCPLKGSNCRLAIVADSLEDLTSKLVHSQKRLKDRDCTKIKDRRGIYFFEAPLSREGSLALLFPGEGSQYINMLADLCLYFPEVRSLFDLADRVFLEKGWEVLPSHLLFMPHRPEEPPEGENPSTLWEINLAVASVFTGDYAMWTLIDRLQIRPQAVVGHSSGEFAALIAAGAMRAENGDELVKIGHDLIRLYTSLQKPNFHARLMTVGTFDPAMVASVIETENEDLYLAMDNCPHQVILCGREAAIERAYESLTKRGAICNFLPYDRPYHTPLYRQVSEQFLQFFQNRRIAAPHAALYSCATRQPYPGQPNKIRQLAVDQWSRTVRFRETIEAMYDDGIRIFVEVGPRGNLTSFVDDILAKRRYLAVPSNLHNRSGIGQINHMVGLLAAHGVDMRLDYLYEYRSPKRVSMKKASPGGQQSEKTGVEMRLTPAVPKLKIKKDSRILESIGVGPLSDPHPVTDAAHSQISRRAEVSECNTPSSEERGGDNWQNLNEAPRIANQREPGAISELQNDSRAKIMRAYFNTMQKFLSAQQNIINAYANNRNFAKRTDYRRD